MKSLIVTTALVSTLAAASFADTEFYQENEEISIVYHNADFTDISSVRLTNRGVDIDAGQGSSNRAGDLDLRGHQITLESRSGNAITINNESVDIVANRDALFGTGQSQGLIHDVENVENHLFGANGQPGLVDIVQGNRDSIGRPSLTVARDALNIEVFGGINPDHTQPSRIDNLETYIGAVNSNHILTNSGQTQRLEALELEVGIGYSGAESRIGALESGFVEIQGSQPGETLNVHLDTIEASASIASQAILGETIARQEAIGQVRTDVANQRTTAIEGLRTETDANIASAEARVNDRITEVAGEVVVELGRIDAAIANIELTPGPQGEQGIQGERGLTGAAGADGRDGTNGTDGTDGAKGDKGDRGEVGATGAQGERGLTGAQGIQGEQGVQGERGERGLQGIQGIQGEAGDDFNGDERLTTVEGNQTGLILGQAVQAEAIIANNNAINTVAEIADENFTAVREAVTIASNAITVNSAAIDAVETAQEVLVQADVALSAAIASGDAHAIAETAKAKAEVMDALEVAKTNAAAARAALDDRISIAHQATEANQAAIAQNSAKIADNSAAIAQNTKAIAGVSAQVSGLSALGGEEGFYAGTANTNGTTAIAVGIQKSLSNSVTWNFGASSDTRGESVTISAGIGWKF